MPSEPSQVTGQFHSVKGTVVEAIGNATGATSWQQSGKEEHAAGEAEHKAAQVKAYGDGVQDRAQGRFDAVVGAVTGDQAKQAKGNVQEEAGKAQTQANNPF
ncbi:unnamed protein product [Mycena citricolor]|uniref:CsbD-like domain-containing protein n=1 Tax=Mycena citricolor TaxID=2018698 RepID=A0AAD2HJU6_9AGAR|nr:unnamed protein product [Mycena citricolor]CAK5277829.1 unnamed protein product [Mycena citricolor]